MVDKHRLDVELVRRKIVDSRSKALSLINEGKVLVDGFLATKPARMVEEQQSIKLQTTSLETGWASRGAHKLLSALDHFMPNGLLVDQRVCLDAGASTGGFTDVLLSRGANKVYAVDVGYGQLIWRLQQDARVVIKDKTNIRYLSLDQFSEPISLIVGDLSFISLTLVLPVFLAISTSVADFLPMVKPQFEVGKEFIGKKGVVKNPEYRFNAIMRVVECALANGIYCVDVVQSGLPGPAGNLEYFIWMKKDPNLHGLADGFMQRLESVVYGV